MSHDEPGDRQANEDIVHMTSQQRLRDSHGHRFEGTRFTQRPNRRGHGAARTQHVVNDQRCAVAHVSNHAVRFDFVAAQAGFVDECHRHLQQTSIFTCQLDGAEVGLRDDGGSIDEGFRRLRQERYGRQVVDRDVEEALDSDGPIPRAGSPGALADPATTVITSVTFGSSPVLHVADAPRAPIDPSNAARVETAGSPVASSGSIACRRWLWGFENHGEAHRVQQCR
jgi:hypothetical protein